MPKKKVLEQAKELLKAAKDNPEQFQELTKAGKKPEPKMVTNGPGQRGQYDKTGTFIPPEPKKPLAKDDMPHAPNTPQDKAHDVAEHTDSIPHAMKILDTPEKQKAMLAHLRTLHDPEQMRSPENKAAGETPAEKEGNMGKTEDILKQAKELLKMAKEDPAKFEEISKTMAPAPAAAPTPKPAGAPMNAKQIYPPAKPSMRMSKDEIKADLAKPWEPKHKKMAGC